MANATRIVVVLMAVLSGSLAGAQDRPAEPRGPGFQLRKLGENLARLDLTPPQQDKVRMVVDDMMNQLDEVRRGTRPGERPAVKIMEIVSVGRSRLTDILTPDQQTKLRDLMQQDRAQDLKREEPAGKNPEPPKVAKTEPKAEPKKPEPPMVKKPEPAMADDMMGAGGGSPGRASDEKPADGGSIISLGQEAPAFTLKATNDRMFALSGFKGRVVVLVFGSYTSPVFRQRVAVMEKLAKDTGLKATFFVVYTREAHALGEWEVERNKDENIQIEQPKTEAERREMAKQAVNTLKITLPVLVDGMDDAIAKAYGLTPNGAVVIGRDGKIAARQKWFEPVALRQMIDTAAAVKNPAN